MVSVPNNPEDKNYYHYTYECSFHGNYPVTSTNYPKI